MRDITFNGRPKRESLPYYNIPAGGVRVIIAALALLISAVVTPFAIADSDVRPNVVVIMADDMGYSDLGCFGGEIRTPNLDRLAGDGLRFTNFYSENMCWVSRAALLTGIYHRTSMVDSGLHPRCVTLPEVLKQHGYQTRMSGKWHLAGKKNSTYPMDRGFQDFYGILGGAASFFAPHSLSRNRQNVEHEANDDPDYYFTDAISDEAVRMVNETKRDDPMFLYIAYTAAHWPLHAPEKDVAEYKGHFSEGWDVLREKRLVRMKKLGILADDVPTSPRHPNVPAWGETPNRAWQERRMEVYAAQVTMMDRGIGRIVEALRQSGRLDNTLIFSRSTTAAATSNTNRIARAPTFRRRRVTGERSDLATFRKSCPVRKTLTKATVTVGPICPIRRTDSSSSTTTKVASARR